MSSHRHEYRRWPFLTDDEFELACAFFDQKYVRASLGPTRQVFKIRQRRALTTNTSYLEILRLLQLPEDDSALSDAFAKMGDGLISERDTEMAAAEDTDHEALQQIVRENSGLPPPYSFYSLQPYVTYEVHLHPTYRVPTLWFTLHDLPMGEVAFDIDSIFRYLVPTEHKSAMRTGGSVGAISAATPEALEGFDCPLREYILVWLGLVGASVGLSVPLAMAQQELSR